MQWKIVFCAAVIAIVSLQTVTVSAALIIGNGSLSDTAHSTNGAGFGAHDGYGALFSMGGTAATVRSARVLMRNTTGASATKSFNARVYNESTITNNPTPAPVISSTFEVSLAATTNGWFTVDFGSGASLASGQNYVFAIEETVKSGTSTISWFEPLNSSTYSSDIGAISLNTFVERLDADSFYTSMGGTPPKFGFQLSTEAVPEPSSLVLMSMGLASVAAAARKSRRKKVAVVGAATGESAV